MRTRLLLPILAVLITLAGCAAIRVDVDVYKGPLANHEDIQVRQHAALAMAARPVLAALRNRIERKHEPAFAIGRDEDWMPRHVFKDTTAKFINGAMSFYEDSGDRVLLAHLYNARAQFAILVAQRGVLDSQTEQDRGIAKALQTAYPGENPNDAKWMFAHVNSGLLLAERVLKHRPQCEGPDAGGSGLADDLQCACNFVKKKFPGDGAAQALRCSSSLATNEAFEVMARRDVIAGYAQLLFGRPHDEYVERMVQKATAYREARQAVRSLWQSYVAIAERLAEIGNQSQIDAAAHLVAQTMQPRTLACQMTASSPGAHSQRLLSILAARQEWPKPGADWSSLGVLKAATFAIEAAVAANPREVTALLREADGDFRKASESSVSSCSLAAELRGRMAPTRAREFGFARGPTLDEETFELAVERVAASLRTIESLGGAGFERGRFGHGIEHLTNDFLQAVSSSGNNVRADNVVAARRRLEESLIQWAERILVVVNNRALMNLDSLESLDSPAGDSKAFAREVAVLQSVANTIVLNSDDNRRRDEHSQRMRDRYAGESDAIRRVFTQSPSSAFDNLLQELRSAIEQGSAQPGADASSIEDLKSQQRAKVDEREPALTLMEVAATVAGIASTDSTAAADAKAVAKVAETAAAANMDSVVAAIKTWVDKEKKLAQLPGVPKSPRVARLGATWAYLDENLGTLKLIEPASGAVTATSVFRALRTRLATEGEKARSYSTKLGEEIDGLDAKIKERSRQANVTQRAAGLSEVRDALVALRGDALKRADELGVRDAAGMQGILSDLVKTKANDTSTTDAQRAVLQQVLAAVRAHKPTGNFVPVTGANVDKNGKPTQKDVTDDLLAWLRAQRVQALAQSDAARAEGLQASIKALTDQRADMAFLRPASAYLRSVYATTFLQSQPDAGWVNMLAHNTLRPLSGAFDSEYKKEYRKTTAEIDKQFWQNINTVNLAGGGNVNYVIAKDDVGNWYVKTYSADPGDIFKSAQGLALFGAGKRLDVNLLRRLQLQRQLDSKETDETAKPGIRDELKTVTEKPSAAGGDALVGVAQRYQADYNGKTKDDAQAFHENLVAYSKTVRAAWENGLAGASKDRVVSGLNAHVPADGSLPAGLLVASDNLGKALAKTDGSDAERTANLAKVYIGALESLRRVRTGLEVKIAHDPALVDEFQKRLETAKATTATAKADWEKATSDETKAAALATYTAKQEEEKKAREDLENAVKNRGDAARQLASVSNSLLQQATKRRLDTVKQLETAYTILGQAASGGP